MQRNWIGKSTGCEIEFDCENGEKIRVYTTRCDTVFGVTYAVLAPEHPLARMLTTPEQQDAVEAYIAQAAKASEIDRLSSTREKTGVFTGSYCINPVNGKRIPVYLADYVLATYGTGAVMAVPAHDERDFAFATKYGLPIVKVIEKKGGETPGPEPQEQKLFLIGDATSAGWTTENAVEMQMTSDGVYTWTGELKEGPFRFVTANGNQTYAPGYWKASKDNCDMSIVYSETSLSGDKDISFTITEAGEYTVTADTKQLFVSLTKKDFTTFEKLWIIGGLNNWSFDTVELDATNKYVMFPDEHNPHIFRWTGEITAGEFKISCDLDKSFFGTWYMPANVKDEFTAGENKEVFLIDRGLPESASTDRNWNLTETGNYTIAINQMTSTMTVTKN